MNKIIEKLKDDNYLIVIESSPKRWYRVTQEQTIVRDSSHKYKAIHKKHKDVLEHALEHPENSDILQTWEGADMAGYIDSDTFISKYDEKAIYKIGKIKEQLKVSVDPEIIKMFNKFNFKVPDFIHDKDMKCELFFKDHNGWVYGLIFSKYACMWYKDGLVKSAEKIDSIERFNLTPRDNINLIRTVMYYDDKTQKQYFESQNEISVRPDFLEEFKTPDLTENWNFPEPTESMKEALKDYCGKGL